MMGQGAGIHVIKSLLYMKDDGLHLGKYLNT